VDINRLPLTQIETRAGNLRIGAMVRNSQLAAHPEVMRKYPVLSQAMLAGASPQIRNMATTGGNLLQAHPLLLFLRCSLSVRSSRKCTWTPIWGRSGWPE
jgi:CO/xanthine dehydrogenase FAD-binding subunit